MTRLLLFCAVTVISGTALAADPASAEYLRYQPPAPATGSNWLSTLAYLLSLLVTFAVILGMAYLATRFFGKQLGARQGAGGSADRVLLTINLSSNRAVHVVDIGGKCFVLGSAEQGVTRIDVIDDPEEVARLREQAATVQAQPEWEDFMQKQVGALRTLAERFGQGRDDSRRRK